MSKITNFIEDARKRGYSDRTIKEAFLNAGWPVEKIDSAFQSLSPKFKSKNQVCIFLSDDLMNVLEKRAKKNMLSINEQIEDILRRSTLSFKKSGSASDINDKLDDHLISLFSRKRTGKRKT